MTLNICSVLAVPYSNSVLNLSAIKQSAAELLQFELWPYDLGHISRVVLCSEIVYTKFKLSQAIDSWNVTIFCNVGLPEKPACLKKEFIEGTSLVEAVRAMEDRSQWRKIVRDAAKPRTFEAGWIRQGQAINWVTWDDLRAVDQQTTFSQSTAGSHGMDDKTKRACSLSDARQNNW